MEMTLGQYNNQLSEAIRGASIDAVEKLLASGNGFLPNAKHLEYAAGHYISGNHVVDRKKIFAAVLEKIKSDSKAVESIDSCRYKVVRQLKEHYSPVFGQKGEEILGELDRALRLLAPGRFNSKSFAAKAQQEQLRFN